MRRCAPFLPVCPALFALAACSSPQPPPTPFGVPAAATPTLPPETPADIEKYGPRVSLPDGMRLKQLGKVAQFGGPQDADTATVGFELVVDSISVDPKCDPYTPNTGRGHRLVLAIRVETSAIYDPVRDGIPQYHQWSTIGPDGVTEGPPSSEFDCHQAKGFPQELRANAKYRGEVTVETSNTAGELVIGSVAWQYPTA